jgi:signal transduction histidine kinase/DNA-binding response OmpR family regulator
MLDLLPDSGSPFPARALPAAVLGGALFLLLLLSGSSARPACAQSSQEEPHVTGVRPQPVVGSTLEQGITIRGRGFENGFTVRLRTDSVDAHITDRSRLDFVSAREVRVQATFGAEAATWTAQVIADDGRASNIHSFEVVAPEPHIEIMRPVERTAGQSGFTLTLYGNTFTPRSVIRWNGQPRPTRPVKTSDSPGALTAGLKAEIPAEAIAQSDSNTVRVYTPGPGGGLSPPQTLFANPRPFYRTLWFYLLLLAGLAGVGFAVHRWRLKNLRERELEREVHRRTEALRQEKQKTEQQAERLRELDAAKSRLFANLSHELRTPLTMIVAPVRHLLDELDGALPPEARSALEDALRNAERLEHRVDRLLELSKLEAGHLSLERRPGDLVAFAREATRAFEPLAERNGLTLRFRAESEPLRLSFDPEHLRTALDNLLSNALKFTPEGGKVLVRVTRSGADAEPGEAQALLHVSDTGPGIPEEEHPHIFDRFHQSDDAATRHHGGTGLGLSLAKELIERHGGTIRLESAVDLGTTFTVALPVREPKKSDAEVRERAEGESTAENGRGGASELASRTPPGLTDGSSARDRAPEAPPAADSDAPALLVVEDNCDVRAFLENRLSEAYRVETAPDGTEALEKAHTQRPALVVSDVMMPGLDGAELCRRLKADDDLGDVPVLLLTARAGETARVEGLDAGADAYVEKPFSMKALRARVRNLIEGRRTLHEKYAGELVVEPTGITVPSEENAFYEKARAVVEDHIGDAAFDVGMFAAEMGAGVQTKRQLRDRLKGATGLPPGRFIRRMRLEHAAQLLAGDGAMRVYEVADAVGYRDAEYFSKRFREHHGVPPSQYPREGEENGGNAAESDEAGDA